MKGNHGGKESGTSLAARIPLFWKTGIDYIP
jgi:hypothetical protein